jgi:chemotaxis protein histidine kinase CheA
MSDLDDESFILELRIQFCHEAVELYENIESVLLRFEKSESAKDIEELKRHLHCLKGNARAVGFENISKLAHEMESVLTEGAVGRKVDTFLKVTDQMANVTKSFLADKNAATILKGLPDSIG